MYSYMTMTVLFRISRSETGTSTTEVPARASKYGKKNKPSPGNQDSFARRCRVYYKTSSCS